MGDTIDGPHYCVSVVRIGIRRRAVCFHHVSFCLEALICWNCAQEGSML